MTEKLYNLTDQYAFLEMEIEGKEGEEEKQLQLALTAIEAKIEDKVGNIGKFILSLEADAVIIQSEEKRLYARRKAVEHRIDWLKSYLLQAMTAANVEKIKRDVLTVSIRVNPVSVNIIDQELIPAPFRRVIPESWEPDKRSIIDNFKATGEILPGVLMVTDKKFIVIK